MDHEHPEPPSFWRAPAGMTLLVAAAVGGCYLGTAGTAAMATSTVKPGGPTMNALVQP